MLKRVAGRDRVPGLPMLKAAGRGRDYLNRETKALNEMLTELRSLIGEIKRSQRDLSNTIEEAEEIISQDEPERIAELVSVLREQDKSLQESVARFAMPA